MSAFHDIYQKVFGNQKNAVSHQELLVRSERFFNDYKHWKNSFQRTDIIQSIRNSRDLKLRKIIGEPDVHILKTNSSSGFAITCGDHIDTSTGQFLLEWFKDQILKLKYKKVNADKTLIERKDHVEIVEKYYLKPIIQSDPPYNQQYGNILIELILINDTPSYLKLLANNYFDRSYQPALLFDDLAKYLLGSLKQ